jgi:transposase
MTHPGVGALTALAFVLIIGEAERFQCGKQIAAYLGLVPEEDASGESRRLGHISKQGSGLMRFFLVEAACRSQYGAMRSGVTSFFISPCDEDARSPKLLWHGD